MNISELRVLRHCLNNPGETIGHFAPRFLNRKNRHGILFYPPWLLEGLPAFERDLTEPIELTEKIIELCAFSRHDKNLISSKKSMLLLCNQLLQNMEHYESGYGHELFNNLRAIYMAGVVFNQPEFCNYARLKIVHVLSELVEYGQLREGSTHYQLIVTSWVRQLCDYADGEFKDFLSQVGATMESVCRKLIGLGLPLFGDINAEDPPQVLARTYTHLREELFGPYWYSLNQGPHKVLARAEPDGDPPNMNHAHNDSLHFTYTHLDTEIFVDPGSFASENSLSSWAHTSGAHNSLSVENKILKPENSQALPPRYRRCHTIIQKSADSLHMTANGLRRFKLGNVTRNIKARENNLRIHDSLDDHNSITLRFHLSEQRKVIAVNSAITIDSKFSLTFSTEPKSLTLTKPANYVGKRFKVDGSTEGLWLITAQFENVCNLTTEFKPI